MRKETNTKRYNAKDIIRLCRKEEKKLTPEGEKFFNEIMNILGFEK